VRLDHVACRCVNANDGIVRADEKLTAFLELRAARSGAASASAACVLIDSVQIEDLSELLFKQRSR
jgi:hypothetical protein